MQRYRCRCYPKISLINDIFQSANPLIYSNHCCKIALNAQCNINYTSVRNETQLRWSWDNIQYTTIYDIMGLRWKRERKKLVAKIDVIYPFNIFYLWILLRLNITSEIVFWREKCPLVDFHTYLTPLLLSTHSLSIGALCSQVKIY